MATRCADSSWLAILALPLGPCFSTFDARAHREGNELFDGDALLAGDDEASNNAEAKLRSDEPPPIDALAEERIDEIQHAMKQAGPKNGSNESAQENWVARDHRQHGAIEKADED